MSESRRVQRIEKELQHLVANYLLRGFKGQLRGLVTISRVESNTKLRTAKIYVSVLGTDEDREASIESLQDRVYEIQKHVNKSLQMKFVPRISFVLDEGLAKLLRVETLLREIALEKTNKSEEE